MTSPPIRDERSGPPSEGSGPPADLIAYLDQKTPIEATLARLREPRVERHERLIADVARRERWSQAVAERDRAEHWQRVRRGRAMAQRRSVVERDVLGGPTVDQFGFVPFCWGGAR